MQISPSFPSHHFTHHGVSYEITHTVIDDSIRVKVLADGRPLPLRASLSPDDNAFFLLISGGLTQVQVLDKDIEESLRIGRIPTFPEMPALGQS